MKGLYIHIPFCVRKCRYCDFVSYCNRNSDFDRYIDTLVSEMKNYSGAEIDTVFMGGGTPTVLSAAQLERVCKSIFKFFKINNDYEFTVEANPGTVDDEKAKALLCAGVNRISLGVQSFNDSELKKIGRIHDFETAYNAVMMLDKSGFDNISIDLMTALPGQSMESLMHSLRMAVTLPIKHISTYSLIIEDNTPMAKDYADGLLELPDEDTDRAMYAAAKRFLKGYGFDQYEISNFAMNGYESRHNIKYWVCEEYIGIGAAAHSYIDGMRFSNTVSLDEYMSKGYTSHEAEVLTSDDMIVEFIIMGMRMNRGISEKEFSRRFGKELNELYGNQLDKFEKGGFIERKDGFVRFTDKGRDVSNSVLCEFC